jgi:hypothetical protein
MRRRLRKVFTPKFKGEQWDIIVHSVDDESYPEIVPPPLGRASGWFKVEFCDLYHRGVEVFLRVETVVMERATGKWALIDYDLVEEVNKERFDMANVFRVGRIPYRNIVEVDDEGDEYYSGPHFYCTYADGGDPYEEIVFKLTENRVTLNRERQTPAIKKKPVKREKPKRTPESPPLSAS